MTHDCPFCQKPILDNQSRVTVYYNVESDGDKHVGTVSTVHRACADLLKPPKFLAPRVTS